MRFLIDTHCWLWTVSAPEFLRHGGADLITSEDNTVVFSAVSALEIAIKVALGKLQLPEPTETFVTSRLEALGMATLPVYLAHAWRSGALPRHHADPFDRLLVAQSQIEQLPLLTADPAMAAYDIELLWVGKGRPPKRPRSF